jgi:hypothetical protein
VSAAQVILLRIRRPSPAFQSERRDTSEKP